jgi:5-methylcytosine-specific restriction endonuclease McrA
MTIDHRHPKSKGGKNNLKNYDTMCKRHNDIKADHVEENVL